MSRRKSAKRYASLVAALVAGGFILSGSEAGAEWFLFRRAREIPAPVPLGTYVRDWQAVQVAAADADHFVIYRHEWFKGGAELGPYGRFHLQEITKRLSAGNVAFPVLIQTELNESLNNVRRLAIINELLAQGIADAQQRVIVAYPKAEGLYGDEAARIFTQQFQGSVGGGGLGSYGGGSGEFGGGLPGGSNLGSSFGSGFGGGFRGY
jgi:hypothetical protein